MKPKMILSTQISQKKHGDGLVKLSRDGLTRNGGSGLGQKRRTCPASIMQAARALVWLVVYAPNETRRQKATPTTGCLLLPLLDEECRRHPYYGTQRMIQYLRGFRVFGQPKTGTAAQANVGLVRHGAVAEHQQTAPAAQAIPVFAAGCRGRPPKPSLEFRHHLSGCGKALCLWVPSSYKP
ncbi:MAG: hypothetical protein NTV43_06145 [Methylococcales bacterium]|nr:hypothetical protein [Methylococcales bacterium]